jgi:hypothetical protein
VGCCVVLLLGFGTLADAQEEAQQDRPSTTNVSGNWSGKYRNTTGGGGAVHLSVSQAGTKITGSATITNNDLCGGTIHTGMRGKLSGMFIRLKGSQVCGGDRYFVSMEGAVYQNQFIGAGFAVDDGNFIINSGAAYLTR